MHENPQAHEQDHNADVNTSGSDVPPYSNAMPAYGNAEPAYDGFTSPYGNVVMSQDNTYGVPRKKRNGFAVASLVISAIANAIMLATFCGAVYLTVIGEHGVGLGSVIIFCFFYLPMIFVALIVAIIAAVKSAKSNHEQGSSLSNWALVASLGSPFVIVALYLIFSAIF